MQERRALIVGINKYLAPGLNLNGAVADATAIASLLARNSDNSPNYNCRLICDKLEDGSPITRASFRQACRKVFEHFKGDVLLYFSGHGFLSQEGGYICTCDAQRDDWGVPMQEIVQMGFNSDARDIVMILDCCHAGDMASAASETRSGDPLATLRENMTVIAASLAPQVSLEAGGHGLFTSAVLEALQGGAADHMGWVTAPSMYSYVERRFGALAQRPVYKSYATRSNIVRQCAPLIDRLKLHQLIGHFPSVDYKYQLDPEYEPEDEHGDVHQPVNEKKVQIALLFKDYRDAGLLKPSEPNEQLFWTARRSHTVELTIRGREYWALVKAGII